MKLTQLTRRELLGGLAAGLALHRTAIHGHAQVTSLGAPLRNTAKACIFVNLAGAPSHVDTFDLKVGRWTPPDFDPQQKGKLVLSRALFPNLLNLADDLCLVRSIESWEAAHERGQFYLQTGHSSNPAFNGETPHIGAVVAAEVGRDAKFPPFLALNGPSGQGAQILGGDVEPVHPPADPEGFRNLRHDFPMTPFDQKYQMLLEMDDAMRKNPSDPLLANHAAYYDRARKMMYDDTIGDAFRMTEEERSRYGDTGFGRACIVARKAVQAANGVRFIHILQDGWDMHQGIYERGYTGNLYQLCQELDRGLGALMADLKGSGHLSSTMIVVMGEFGRTPGLLNGQNGRDHHKKAMAALLAGGGVRGGSVIGATDAIGRNIIEPGWRGNRPIRMEDISATIYSALGIDYTKVIQDTPSGRRYEYVQYASNGLYKSVDEVFA